MTARSLLLLGCVLAVGCGGPEGAIDDPVVSESARGIIGGTTDNGDPSVVAVFVHAPGSSSGSLCSGSVISPDTVLTAAHCVDPSVVGSGNVFEVLVGTTLSSATSLAVASTAFDPAFDPSNLTAGHDIGVLKLAAPTSLTPLPYNRGALGTGSVRLVGYGTNSHRNTGAGTKRRSTASLTSRAPLMASICTSSTRRAAVPGPCR